MRQRLRRTRVRLTLTYVAAFGVLAALAGAGFWLVFAHFEYATVDQALTAQARSIASGLNVDNGAVNFGADVPLPGETTHGIAVTALLVGPTGTIIDQSGGNLHPRPLARVIDRAGPRGTPFSVTLAGHPNRVLVLRVASGHASLVLARPIGELQHTLAETALLLLAIGIGLLVSTAALGYWVAGRALRPVRVMAATVRDISEHDLGRRLGLDMPPGDELGELSATFDAMLSRLETAFDGLRRFTADAAHELRAPLTLMRSQLEVTLRRERTPDEYQASHRILLTELDRLSRTAEQLLLLARADAGALHPRQLPLDVDDFVEEVVTRWLPLAQRQQLHLRTEVQPDGGLVGDPDLLRRCLDNLLDNALRHTPAGGAIVVSAAHQGSWWTLAVDDSGPGIDPALRASVFDRFTRADEARTPTSGGAGLGLSLCRAIAAAHGGDIGLAATDRGARFVVRLPARRTDRSHDRAPGAAGPGALPRGSARFMGHS
ncbi:MAG TPA: ATP-binding protein [Candidatus Micrarchaeia archaeon]|nr:ATP-binding protein [Candidatus Micrarchaeia archaeon]